jgi:hypothetical protein
MSTLFDIMSMYGGTYNDRHKAEQRDQKSEDTAREYEQLLANLDKKRSSVPVSGPMPEGAPQAAVDSNLATQQAQIAMPPPEPKSMGDQWKEQVNAMIMSGNPELQSTGLGMMNNLLSIDNRPSQESQPDRKTNDILQFEREQSDPAFKSYMDMQRTPKSGSGRRNSAHSAKLKEAASQMESVYSNLDGMLFKGTDSGQGIYQQMNLSDPTNFVERAKGMITGITEPYIQSNPNFKVFQNYVDTTLIPLLRSYGDTGTISNQDVKKARGMMPIISGVNQDTEQSAKDKMKMLKDHLKKSFERASDPRNQDMLMQQIRDNNSAGQDPYGTQWTESDGPEPNVWWK